MRISIQSRVATWLRAAWKYCASFSKRDWDFADYPIRLREQHASPTDPPGSRKNLPRWVASIDRWPGPSGTGETQQEALHNLRTVFQGIRESSKRLPRPGVKRPIIFASSTQVDRYPALRDDFICRVLELEWAFISDESSLSEFHIESDNSYYFERIWTAYGVDVSGVQGGNLAEILSQIMTEIGVFPENEIARAIRMSYDASHRRVTGLSIQPWMREGVEEDFREP